tara:strand:+ start:282 stop:560 length:279 start_codon:yes stop_codon:yes gene_type:complete
MTNFEKLRSEITIEEAMSKLKAAMKESDYAYAWHANITMMCHDALREVTDISHKKALLICNDGASRFMKLAFDTETSQDMLLSENSFKGVGQ